MSKKSNELSSPTELIHDQPAAIAPYANQIYFPTVKNVQLSGKQIFTVFIKQSSAEKLNAFLKKVSLKKTVDDQTDEWMNKCLNFLLGRWSKSTSHVLTSLSGELDIDFGNHALRAQPTDYSLICRLSYDLSEIDFNQPMFWIFWSSPQKSYNVRLSCPPRRSEQ